MAWEVIDLIRSEGSIGQFAVFVQEGPGGKVRPAPQFSEDPKRRMAQKLRNYERGRAHMTEPFHSWNPREEKMILARKRPGDRELALIIGASVEAIQVRRARIRAVQRRNTRSSRRPRDLTS